jgi:transposase-like protein
MAVEIITGVERRRRWGLEEKLRIVAEVERLGASFIEVARKHEVSRSLLWNWRRQVRRGTLRPVPITPEFLPVQVVADPERREVSEPPATSHARPVVAEEQIEITLADGTSIRVGRQVDAAALRRVLTVLRR